MKLNKIQIVAEILEDFPETRSNDNELIYRYLKRMGMPTDYEYLRHYDVNVSESIRRTRQKIQERNTMLRANEPTLNRRLVLERTIRETMRGV